MAPPYIGRRTPYTEAGIKRVPCSRCGQPSYASWQACANGSRHIPMCKTCDVLLNATVLRFMRLPGAEALISAYRKRVNG